MNQRTNGPAQKFEQIAADLRAEIADGLHPPGARLPGENDLVRTYGVARMTARNALHLLQDQGLVVIRRGAGAFVPDRRLDDFGTTRDDLRRLVDEVPSGQIGRVAEFIRSLSAETDH